jgi:eukaryotic-like serine/threonine-protein kinase
MRPFDLLVQRPEEGDRPLPSGTTVLDVFDEMDQSLLILGAPGSGKTTLLLELARDLLERATHEPAHPMPVVFPLSTWAASRKPLVEWLVDELNLRYDVPRKLAQDWVASDRILPLLDGLDEVKAEHRAACVAAINTFRQSHGLLPLVITSRTADYEALAEPLRLPGAILVRPLTNEQVNSYLTELGSAGEPVRAALREDSSLWELLDSPLLLNIVTLAYAGQVATPPQTNGTAVERRDHLFGSYVNQMLRRRAAEGRYTPGKTLHWLSWLAHQLALHGQTVFYLERLQFDWVPQGQRHSIGVHNPLLFGPLAGLALGLFVGRVFGAFFGLLRVA